MRVCSCTGCAAHPARCPRLTQAGRCTDCRRVSERARGSAAARGYDATWSKTRAAYLSAYPRCQRIDCDEPATEVDHIDGLGPHGPRGHDWTNLRGLCKPHHSQRTAQDQPGGWAR